MPADETEYARKLARTLADAAEHRHVVPERPWQQDTGRYAFGVELVNADDLPSGFSARVVITVSSS